MKTNFKLLTTPSKHLIENTVAVKSTDFIEFNRVINENYIDVVTANRISNEILLEAKTNGISEDNYTILNEGVLGAIFESIGKLLKSIIAFIKGLLDKLNLFADSMTSNIQKWLKNVAPVAMEHAKNPTYLNRLTYEGYKWNEAFITRDLSSNIEGIDEVKIMLKSADINTAGEVEYKDEPIKGNISDFTDFVSSTKTKIKKLFDYSDKKKKELEEEEKTKAASDKNKETSDKDGKSEMKIDIPDVKKSDAKDSKTVESDANGKDTKNTYKKVIDEYLNRTFSANRDNYVEVITKKAHNGEKPTELTKFTSATIKAHIDFISKSPTIIENIRKRYSDLLEKFGELENEIESLSNNSGDGGVQEKYIKNSINAGIAFIRECTVINNILCKTNIKLVEECTKEYIKICNKLALMGKE